MKKLFATLMIMLAFVSISLAQPRAIGGRIGYNLEFIFLSVSMLARKSVLNINSASR